LAGGFFRFLSVDSVSTNVSHEESFYPLNINNASQKELEKIPGIGEKIAQQIVEYRRQYGEFKSLNDLKKIKGIGEKKGKSIKAYITF
jgi:competence protein ComEA